MLLQQNLSALSIDILADSGFLFAGHCGFMLLLPARHVLFAERCLLGCTPTCTERVYYVPVIVDTFTSLTHTRFRSEPRLRTHLILSHTWCVLFAERWLLADRYWSRQCFHHTPTLPFNVHPRAFPDMVKQ